MHSFLEMMAKDNDFPLDPGLFQRVAAAASLFA